jgi:hypothetical protein
MASLDAALGKTMAKAGFIVCPSKPDRGRECRRTATVETHNPRADRLSSLVLTRFLYANRFPLRLKTL